MRPIWMTGAAVIAVMAMPAMAQSQTETDEQNGDEIVVTGELSSFSATKNAAPIVETARSLSIETDERFFEKGALTLSQTTSYMANVTGEAYGFATRGDFFSSRGLDIPRYRDSIQELFGSYNSTRADVYTIEQVEVLKGPASVLYGQGSPGGILNYASKTPRADRQGEVRLQLGNFDRKEIAADITGPIAGNEEFLYRMVALYRDTGTQIEEVDEETYVLMPSLTWAPADETRFTVIGLVQDTESDTAAQFIPVEGTLFPLDDGSYLDFEVYAGEPDFNRYDTNSSQVTFLGEHRINEALTLEGTALWRSGEADYHQAWPLFTGAGASRYLNDLLAANPPLQAAADAQGLTFTDTTVPRTFYQGDNTFDQLAGDVRLRAEFTTGALEHEVLGGLQVQTVETDSNTAYFAGAGATAGDFRYVLDLKNPVYGNVPDQAAFDAIYNDAPTQDVEDIGLYVSDQIAVGNWRFTAGVRADRVESDNGTVTQEDDAVSTSIGALYAFDNGLSPYVSYAESFEPVIGLDNQGNQLEPEEGRQYEVGIKYEPQGIPALITAAYYDIEISNLPNPNSLPGDAAQQQGVSKLKGFEVEAQAQLDTLYLQGAFSVSDNEDPNGFELASIPDSNASVWATWRPEGQWTGFKAGAGVRYVGESVSENGTVRYVTPDYTLADLMVGYEWDNWDATVNARNVGDEEYLTACLTRGDCFPGLRRTVVGTLRYRF